MQPLDSGRRVAPKQNTLSKVGPSHQVFEHRCNGSSTSGTDHKANINQICHTTNQHERRSHAGPARTSHDAARHILVHRVSLSALWDSASKTLSTGVGEGVGVGERGVPFSFAPRQGNEGPGPSTPSVRGARANRDPRICVAVLRPGSLSLIGQCRKSLLSERPGIVTEALRIKISLSSY